jgi:hypothetical protein
MSACVLLDPFGLSMYVQPLPTSALLGMVIFYCFFLVGRGDSNKKFGLRVIQRRLEYILISM